MPKVMKWKQAATPRKAPHNQTVRLCTATITFLFLIFVLTPKTPLSPSISSILSVRLFSHGDRTKSTALKKPIFVSPNAELPTQEWKRVIRTFLSTSPHLHYRSDRMRLMHKRNKSFTCALVTIREGVAEVEWSRSPRAAKYLNEGRLTALEAILIALQPKLSHLNVTVLVDLTDGLRRAPATTFAIARVWRVWTSIVPVPLGDSLSGWENGTASPVVGWDDYAATRIVNTWESYPWSQKKDMAVFRGVLNVCAFILGTCNYANAARCEKTEKWDQCARGILFRRTRRYKELFDIGFTRWMMKEGRNFHQMDGAPTIKDYIPYTQFQKKKYIINVGSNQDWSDRLRSLMHMNSVILQHQAEAAQFFTPLLKPWVHYVPFNLNMTDLVKNVRYMIAHEGKAHEILEAQHDFARKYLSEVAMLEYWRIALFELAKRQKVADDEFQQALRRRNVQPQGPSLNPRVNHS